MLDIMLFQVKQTAGCMLLKTTPTTVPEYNSPVFFHGIVMSPHKVVRYTTYQLPSAIQPFVAYRHSYRFILFPLINCAFTHIHWPFLPHIFVLYMIWHFCIVMIYCIKGLVAQKFTKEKAYAYGLFLNSVIELVETSGLHRLWTVCAPSAVIHNMQFWVYVYILSG